MSVDPLQLGSSGKSHAKDATLSEKQFERKIHFDGFNKDIIHAYYWHLNFAYLVGKGYKALKLEDYHYFSENSQFGTQVRQVKGGTIKAFQENLSQLVQLIKVHLMPLLQELKKTEYYHGWFKQIVDNDKLLKDEKKRDKSDADKIAKYRRARNEAINQVKDKWVTEVEGGRMYQIQKSQAEQGLDFTLLPDLFFGISLDDPLNKDTIASQLETDIYPVDISEGAKRQVASHLFRFHHWLPGAIQETSTTFRIKISALKQFYAQIQMYISFMKPLLIEIARKSEGFENDNFYRGFELDNPDIVNLFDYSYSFVRLFFILGFERQGYKIQDLEFSRYGLFLRKKGLVAFGNKKLIGKQGYILGEVKGKYAFLKCDIPPDKLTVDEFNKLKKKWEEDKVYIAKEDLITFPVQEYAFAQRRVQKILQTPEGAQPTPYMMNEILSRGYTWNIYEMACYREKLKLEDLQLLETFIDEIGVIKEDLMKYLGYVEGGKQVLEPEIEEKEKDSKKKKFLTNDYPEIFGPFQALGSMFSPLFPGFGGLTFAKKKKATVSADSKRDHHHYINKLILAEDGWKVYTIYKKANGFMQY